MGSSSDRSESKSELPTEGRSPLRGAELRERLIDSGLALIERSGHAGLSLREMARASGVSHMAPYGFFRSKNELLSAVAAAGFKAFRVHLGAAAASGGTSPRRQLQEFGLAYVEFALDHPQLLRLMFGGVIPADQQSEELRAAHGQAFRDSMGIIAAGVACGEFRHGDPAIAAFAGWSVVHGFTQLVLGRELQEKFGTSLESIQSAAQRVIETFLCGLDA
jgi:AcrR family transcriptional regulator